jgi:hypothetical protein
MKKNLKTKTVNFTVDLKDYQSSIPDFNVDITLTSNEMYETINIEPDLITKGQYLFNNIITANYTLNIKYKNFEIKEKIDIQKNDMLSINLYNLQLNLIDKLGLPPEATLDVYLESDDFEKQIIMYGEPFSKNGYLFPDLYPGKYTIKIGYKNYLTEKTIEIPYSMDNLTMVFSALWNLTLKIYDNHGNILQNARVVIERNNHKKHIIENYTDYNGETIFNIPPGEYNTKIYYDNCLVAERKINVLTGIKLKIAKKKEPIAPSLIMVLALIVLIGFTINCYRKKQKTMFLKILALTLAVVALVSPWWNIDSVDDGENVETSTNMYLSPTEMITITSKTDTMAGELEKVDDDFLNNIGYMPIIQIIAMIMIILTLFLSRFRKNILSLLTSIIAVLLLVINIAIFYIGMSEFSNYMVGSFIGNGNITVNIPGENLTTSVYCSWGPNLGFYLTIIAFLILLIITIVNFYRKIIKKNS